MDRRRTQFVTAVACAAVLAVIASFVAGNPSASAQGGLRARVFITQAQIPNSLNEAGLLRFMGKHNAKKLRETTEAKLDERKWLANMVASFNRIPGDLEFQVVFFDIEDGAPRYVDSLTTYMSDRNQKTFVRPLRLSRPKFQPNRRMEMVVTVRREEVARHRFELIGERKQHSGEVSFSDDEARGR